MSDQSSVKLLRVTPVDTEFRRLRRGTRMNRLDTIPAISIDITTVSGCQDRERHCKFAAEVGTAARYRVLLLETHLLQNQLVFSGQFHQQLHEGVN